MADDSEDVLESWEDVDAEVFERRMEERQKQQEKEKKKIKQVHTKSAASTNMKGRDDSLVTPLEVQTHLPLRTQEAGRTEYVAQIKILKRNVQSQQSTAQSSTASPVQRKSLAEREADYASARARILGETSGSSTPPPPKSTPKSHVKSHSVSPHGAESTAKRQPRGPNGTRGFKSRPKS